nr:K702 [uncultured bacterium]
MPIRILSWCGKGGFDQGQQGMTFLGNDEIFRNVCCVDIDQPETWCRLIG